MCACCEKSNKETRASEPERAEVGETMMGSFKVLELNAKVLDFTVREMESQYRVLITEESLHFRKSFCMLQGIQQRKRATLQVRKMIKRYLLSSWSEMLVLPMVRAEE